MNDTDVTLLAGELPIRRIGLGAMRITGRGVWGPPPDRDAAIALLRHAVDLGVNFVDTADSYGPDISEELIGEAFHPYPTGLIIGTKGGMVRAGPWQWAINGDPAHLRDCVEGSLRRLRTDTIDLYQLHRPDPNIPIEESLGALAWLFRTLSFAVPIPGTSSPAHLQENVAALALASRLTPDDIAELATMPTAAGVY